MKPEFWCCYDKTLWELLVSVAVLSLLCIIKRHSFLPYNFNMTCGNIYDCL